ncbi:MAG TPA: class IV adenylate cyclase [Candidatus Paceibacterota bacterium]|nr:class IV adenylate cyclase [Candidatus Paceibacterota bacterium]
MEEIEIKFLDVDREALERRLNELGAKKVGDYHYRRVVFDHPDFRLDKNASWLRLRDEGDKVTLTFKQRLGVDADHPLGGDKGMYERETIVQDFDATREILLKIGLVEKMYQENKRTRYVLNEIECDIDTWPLLEPYLEIEGKSWDEVYRTAETLGFDRKEAKIFSANQIYRLRGLDDRNYKRLTFEEQIKRQTDRF